MNGKKRLAAMIGITWLASAGPVMAYTVSVDEFSVSKEGSTIFTDSFSDGLVPPNNPVSPYTYTVNGTLGPENSGGNGRLIMDQSGAAYSTNSLGQGRAYQAVQLNTNDSITTDQNDSNYNYGLKTWHDFSASVTFDYSAPSPGLIYGLRLVDFSSSNSNSGNDTLFLTVYGGGTPMIAFYEQDYLAHTQTLIDSAPIFTSSTPVFDQVRLMLTHAGGSSNISASWDYLFSGSVVGTGSFSSFGTLFSDEPFTRASFIVSAPVPEPGTFAMLLAGLGMIGMIARRRRNIVQLGIAAG